MTSAGMRFQITLGLIGGVYVAFILAMLAADLKFTSLQQLQDAFDSPPIRYSIRLSLMSCLVTTLLSVWVAVPLGYLMSRSRFYGKAMIDTVVDIPIVLPPLVIGLSLLILFQTSPGKWLESHFENHMGIMVLYGVLPFLLALLIWIGSRSLRVHYRFVLLLCLVLCTAALLKSGLANSVENRLQTRLGTSITYAVPGVILAQFAVSCAFAVRTMRLTFDQISPRTEQVALTLGCTRSQAFWMVSIPEAWRGIVSAACIAWARALGEFGPIIVFAGATRMKTEVLSTTVFLELSVGRLESAIAVSLFMVVVAVLVLLLMRGFGLRNNAL